MLPAPIRALHLAVNSDSIAECEHGHYGLKDWNPHPYSVSVHASPTIPADPNINATRPILHPNIYEQQPLIPCTVDYAVGDQSIHVKTRQLSTQVVVRQRVADRAC